MNDFLADVEQSYAAVEDPERQAVLRRVWATLVRGVMNSSEEAVKALQSLDDANLLGTLAKEQLSKTKLPADRRARMRLKGVSRFNHLIAEKGGVYT
ncbi:MAG: hypothetical protein ACR2PS_02060, partial [Pseudomonadales bacterium]